MWLKVVVTKKISEDGLFEMMDYVKVGDTYSLNLDSISLRPWRHLATNKEIFRLSGLIAGNDHAGQMPLEFFEAPPTPEKEKV